MKKRSIGVTVFSSVFVLYGLGTIASLLFLPGFLDYSKQLKPIIALSSNLYYFINMSLQFLYILAGVLIFRLNEKGRKLIIKISISKLILNGV